MAVQDVKEMTMEALESEFKELANQLTPINARRAEISKEMNSRVDATSIGVKLDHFFPSKDDKKAAFKKLQIELGEK